MSLFSSPEKIAAADSAVYACVYKEDTLLYSDEAASSPLFVLPQSYYVLVLAKGEECSYVKYLEDYGGYKSVYGYVKTSELLFVGYTPLRPYLYKSFDVRYSLDNSSPDYSLSGITYTCRYYGYLLSGESLSAYVLINDSFGYIPLSSAISYEKNTDYLPYISLPAEKDTASSVSEVHDTEEAQQPSSEGDNKVLLIVIILSSLLLIAGVAAAALHRDKRRRFREE